jgi:RNA polymerase sigma-70 factor (ECF subfamily)
VVATDGVTDADAAQGDDAALVARVVQRDRAALEVLYRRHGAACYALARRLVADPHLAEDVVQEVFVALWRGAGYQPGRGAVGTWLLSVTHHRAVDVIRREENHRKRRTPQAVLEDVAVAGESPDDAAWTGLRRAGAHEAIRALPHDQREMVVLAYFGGYTQREIAGITGVPLGTVKSRTFAAMQRMRDMLEHVHYAAGPAMQERSHEA